MQDASDKDFCGLVRASHQWTRSHEGKAERFAFSRKGVELPGINVSIYRSMLGRGSEVLADRQDVDAHASQVAHGLHHLAVGLADPDHDRALRDTPRRAL